MKYILKDKKNDASIEYSSLSQIARDLDTTYSTVWKSYMYDIKPETKRGIKQSQKQFDEKFSVQVVK